MSRPHYLGRFPGNRFDFDGSLLPEEEWTWVPCPQLISQEQFGRVAALREARAPRLTAPREISGPTLLVGLAKCGMPDCGAGMTIATGKGGQYKYYKCHAKTNRGASSCSCPNVRAERLDALVMAQVADQIFDQNKLEPLLQRVLDMSDEARENKQSEVDQCKERLGDARGRLANLHDAIELGTFSARDPDIAARIKERRVEIDGFNQTLKTLRQQLDRGPTRITPKAVRKFGEIVRRELTEGSGPARQKIARAFIREVRICKKIEISGDTDA